MLTVGALLLDCHFRLCTFFLLDIGCYILSHPISIFVYFHVGFDGLPNKFLEAELFLASWASDFVEKSVKVDQASTFGTKIRLIILHC